MPPVLTSLFPDQIEAVKRAWPIAACG